MTAGRPSSSLVPRDFSVENTPSDSAEQDFRFTNFRSTRQALLRVIDHLQLSTQQQERFTSCGTDAWIQREASSGDLRLTSKTCKLRFCPACRLRKARKTRESITVAMTTAPLDRWRFMTLTARHNRKPLTEQLANIRAAFRRLRQRKAWKSHVDGGVAVIEIAWNAKTRHWHPHLHLIVSGSYFPNAKLSKAWLAATRTSYITDIRSIWNVDEAVDYITKYITKSPLPAVLDDPEPLIEFVTATARGHMLIPFGSAKTSPPEDAEPVDRGQWEPLCSLNLAIRRAKTGEPFWVHVLDDLADRLAHEPATDRDRDRDPPERPG